MNITNEDIQIIKDHIANVFPILNCHRGAGYGSKYPYNMSSIRYTLDLPELHDEWELIKIYEDNSVCLDKTLYHGKKFNCARSWDEVPFYKDHEDVDFICKCVTQLATDHKRFKLERKLKEIKHDFR